jgi:hypothetical protein
MRPPSTLCAAAALWAACAAHALDARLEESAAVAEQGPAGGEARALGFETGSDASGVTARGGGARELTPRIVGGTPVPANSTEFLWLASLQSNSDGHYCGGSLIAPGYVLTAAHCLDDSDPPDKVLLGFTNLGRPGQAVTRTVTRVVIHAEYNSRTQKNDIALLQLSAPVTTIKPVELVDNPSQQEAALSNAVAAGWGVTRYDSNDVSNALREVTLPIQSYATCTAKPSYPSGVYRDVNLCAGLVAGGKDSCQGDSGGPLLYKSGSVKKLIGVVSWGEDCGKPYKYGIYTRVSFYKTWLGRFISEFSPTPSPAAAAPTTASPQTPSLPPSAPVPGPTLKPTTRKPTSRPTRQLTSRPTRKPTESPTADYSSTYSSSSSDPCLEYDTWKKCLPRVKEGCKWNLEYWLCESSDDLCLQFTTKTICAGRAECKWTVINKKSGQCETKS